VNAAPCKKQNVKSEATELLAGVSVSALVLIPCIIKFVL